MRLQFTIIFATLAALVARPVFASDFVVGEFVSFSQTTWGSKPPIGPPGTIVIAPNPNGGQNFDFVYQQGMIIGLAPTAPGYRRVIFDSGIAVINYMPNPGTPGTFDSNQLDPGGPGQSTSAGVFGGQIAALFLNIDFNDFGIIGGTSSIKFGDLVIGGYAGALAGLDGMTVRQYRDLVNTAIGNGSTPYTIQELSDVLMPLNGAFEGGFVSAWAPEHLSLPAVAIPPSAVPEPSQWSMLIIGFGLAGVAMRQRNGKDATAKRGPNQSWCGSSEA